MLGHILVIFVICHSLMISGLFEYYSEKGALRKSKLDSSVYDKMTFPLFQLLVTN